MNTQTIISVLPLGPAAYVSLACGALTLLLATLLCRSFGLFRRFRRPGSRVLCVLASALVLNAGAITARSKGFYRPRLVHFADEPADGTVAEVATILDQSNPTAGDVFSSRTTVEALLADEGLFSSIFGCQFHDDSPPFVYIEGGTHDAGDLAPLFEKYGERIEEWVRDGGRLLVNASPPSGRCELPFGAALVGGEGSSCVEPIAYYQQPFYLAPSLLHGASAVANDGDRLSDGRIDTDAVMYDFWASEGMGLRVYPDIAPSAIGFIAPTNALGSVMYSSLLGPSHFHMEESSLETVDDPQTWQEHVPQTTSPDGTTLWSRLLYWAFRYDGFHSFWPSQMDGDLFVAGRFSIQAGYLTEAEMPIYLFTRGSQIDNVAVAECDWLSVPDGPADTMNLTPSIPVSLSAAAADLSPGVYTGSVVVANAASFDPPRGDPGFDPTPLYNLMDYPWSPFPSAQRHWFILTVGDPPPYAGTFRIAEGGGHVREAEGAVARFTVVRESADLPAATVRFRTENNTAIAGTDYTAVWRILEFPEGVATNVVEIPILDNARLHTYSTLVEARSFFVRLSNPSDGAKLGDGSPSAAIAGTVFIDDDEHAPLAWSVRPATGGWNDIDTTTLRLILLDNGTLPAIDLLKEATFEDADPAKLFGPDSDCVLLNFGSRDAAYIDSVLAPWRDAIETWVRRGGRLLLNCSPESGPVDLPYGPSFDGGHPVFLMGSGQSFLDGDEGWNFEYASGKGPFLLVADGAGTIAYASQSPPESTASTSWRDLLSRAFRVDGFCLAATEDWTPEGDVGDSASFSTTAKAYGVYNLGTTSMTCSISTDVDWLVAESDSASLSASEMATIRISLATNLVAALPAGVHTGTVSFAKSGGSGYEMAISGWGTLTCPPPEYQRTVVLTIHSGDDPDPGPGPGPDPMPPDPAPLPEEPLLSIATYGNDADASLITVSWTGGEGTTSFNLYRSATKTRPDTPLRENVTSPFIDDDPTVAPGIRYYYWVEAVNETGSVFGKPDWGNRAVALSFGTSSVSVSCATGTREIAVSANTSWTATCDAPWVTLGAATGDGDGALVVAFAANPDTGARSARIVVTAGGDTPYPRTAAFTLAQAGTPTFTVAFAPNGGTGKMAAQKVVCGKATALSANAFTRKGYVFLGWAKSKSGAVAYKNKASVKNLAPSGGKATLYAKWAKKSYKVAFYANAKNAKGKMAAETMIYGKAKRLSANKFKRDGYVFKGWAKSQALAKKGKVAYKNKQSVKNLVTDGKTVKLYAVWKRR